MKRGYRIEKHRHRVISLLMTMILLAMMITGCTGQSTEETENDKASSGNVIITETGEVLEIEGPEMVETTPEPTTEPVTELTENQEIITPEEQVTEPEQEAAEEVPEPEQVEHDDEKLQLVFLGDSIFDNNRDGTGVPYLTGIQCDANVYNLAIAGTSATIEDGEKWSVEEWTSRSLCGVVYAMQGKISTDIFEGTTTKMVLDDSTIDFSQTDYFIIEYGLNDFFRGVPRDGAEHPYDVRTYVGALRFAINNLRSLAPDATIILCAPNYARFFVDGWMIGDGNSVNNGNGTLFDYKGSCEAVSTEMNTLFLDAYNALGINGYTAEEYLEDGVHLTQKGRQLYADALARIINGYEETKNN